jgi:hypothetical protein
MSKKARRRPTWHHKVRRYPRKHQCARYRLPYNKYWTVGFYDWFDSLQKEVVSLPEEKRMIIGENAAHIMKNVFYGKSSELVD